MERLTLAALAHLPTAAVFVADLTGTCGTSVADQWAVRWGRPPRRPSRHTSHQMQMRTGHADCRMNSRQNARQAMKLSPFVVSKWRLCHDRRSLRERFPGKLWLDVLSKADLLEEEFDAAADVDPAAALQAAEQAAGPDAPAPTTSSSSSLNGSEAAASGSSAAVAGAGQNGSSGSLPAGGAVSTAAGRTEVWGGAGASRSSSNDISNAVQMAAALPHALRVSATSGFGMEDLKVLPPLMLCRAAAWPMLALGALVLVGAGGC